MLRQNYGKGVIIMPLNLRGKPIDESTTVGTNEISTVGCGVISVVLTAAAGTASSVTLYDVAASGDVAAATAKKALACGGTSGIVATEVYCPCKPDAYSNGVFATLAGASAKAYISIEP